MKKRQKASRIIILMHNYSSYDRKVRLYGYDLIMFKEKVLEDFKDVKEIR